MVTLPAGASPSPAGNGHLADHLLEESHHYTLPGEISDRDVRSSSRRSATVAGRRSTSMHSVTKPLFVAALAVACRRCGERASLGCRLEKSFCKGAHARAGHRQPDRGGTTLGATRTRRHSRSWQAGPDEGLKVATKNVASYCNQIADGESPADISTSDGESTTAASSASTPRRSASDHPHHAAGWREVEIGLE
jgi:hypothetical protein